MMPPWDTGVNAKKLINFPKRISLTYHPLTLAYIVYVEGHWEISSCFSFEVKSRY